MPTTTSASGRTAYTKAEMPGWVTSQSQQPRNDSTDNTPIQRLTEKHLQDRGVLSDRAENLCLRQEITYARSWPLNGQTALRSPGQIRRTSQKSSSSSVRSGGKELPRNVSQTTSVGNQDKRPVLEAQRSSNRAVRPPEVNMTHSVRGEIDIAGMTGIGSQFDGINSMELSHAADLLDKVDGNEVGDCRMAKR